MGISAACAPASPDTYVPVLGLPSGSPSPFGFSIMLPWSPGMQKTFECRTLPAGHEPPLPKNSTWWTFRN